MSKKIFVIGANSTVAQAILPLLAKDNTVTTAGRHDCDVYCDVTESVTIPGDSDVVINFAAGFGGVSDEEMINTVAVNVSGALRVCQAAKQANVAHMIHISSSFALLPTDDPNYSLYALTKRQSDELVTFYSEHNQLPVTILRPSRVYGDSTVFAKGQPFLYKLIDTARKGEDITLYGTNDARRNYIHAEDLAEILVRVINDKVTGTYNCINPVDDTYEKIALAAQGIFGKGGKIIHLEDKPDVPNDMALQDTKLYEKIHYQPAISIEMGIGRIKQHAEKELSS